MHPSVACRTLALHDAALDAPFPAYLFHPTRAPAQRERIGLYEMDVALDGPPEEGRFPLVVVSHGTGGSPLTHRLLAAHLARHGFVVALPQHPRNNRDDDSLARTHTLLEARPRQITLTIDAVQGDATLAPHLTPDVALVGHSLGAYTALAAAGGEPYAGPHETPDGRPRPVPVTPDGRVRALVLLAPAVFWLAGPDALANVGAPILLWGAGRDAFTPAAQGDVVERGVRGPVERHEVAEGNHYAFLSPFPPERTRPDFPPSQDPPGFDRARFHGEALYPSITDFLRRTLRDATP